MNKKKRTKGITLIGLVVTIIILLILAGITISQLVENGLFNNSRKAQEEYESSQELENETIEGYQVAINEYVDGTIVPTYTLSYNANGGTGTIQAQSGRAGTKITLAQNELTRANYSFRGWGVSKTASNSNEIYQPGTKITLSDDMELYAIWKLETLGTGAQIKYKNYNFVIYGEENNKYLVRPVYDCGMYSDNTPATSIENYVTTTFGMTGKIEATIFTLNSSDIEIVKQCGINNGDIWMYYRSGIYPISTNFKSYITSNQEVNEHLVPKLIIDPSVVVIEGDKSYATIEGDST